jgi:7,8-dihydropterin-6-yl-methyl-4-(beta-D-ribofuranosyl)aminobenzene 5'-phosphate synthase
LVLQTSQGLVVVCGCCHAGLLNTLAHIRLYFYQPLKAIIGGTHLAGAVPETLDRVVAELGNHCEGSVPDLYLNHCTGEVALFRLAHAFGEKVHPCPAGLVLIFE